MCPRYNYWYPSFKRIDKLKQGDGRYKKVYEKVPAPPCQRLLESPLVSDESKAELEMRKGSQNPVELNARLNEAIERRLKLTREKASMKQTSAQEGEQAEAV